MADQIIAALASAERAEAVPHLTAYGEHTPISVSPGTTAPTRAGGQVDLKITSGVGNEGAEYFVPSADRPKPRSVFPNCSSCGQDHHPTMTCAEPAPKE